MNKYLTNQNGTDPKVQQFLIQEQKYLQYFQGYIINTYEEQNPMAESYVYDNSYKQFSENLQKMQLKKKGDRGFIIVGPSKNGKTCIFCSICGIKVRRVLDKQLQLYRLQPQQEKQLVNQDPVSTTQHPNVRICQQMGKITQIIDMPGHSDNQSLRKLCNFFYIRQMALKLEKFNFLIVLNIYDQQQLTLDANNLDMLKSFTEMFKKAQKYVNFCINKSLTDDSSAIITSLTKQIRNQLGQNIYSYYKYALQNQKICLIPDATMMQKNYLQTPYYITQLIQSQNYKKRQDDEFGKMKFDASQKQDMQTQNNCKQYCRIAYKSVTKLIKVVFTLTGAFMMFFLKNKKIPYEQIIESQNLEFNVGEDNQQKLCDLKDRIQYKLNELSPKKKSSMFINEINQQKNFIYLDILLNQLEQPFKLINSIREARGNNEHEHIKANLSYEAVINQFIQAIRQIAEKAKSFHILGESKKNISLDFYLNSLSLFNIRKWKQINFLQEAVDNPSLMLSSLVINAQDTLNQELTVIIQPICQIFKSVRDQMGANISQQAKNRSDSIYKSIIEQTIKYGQICNRLDQSFFQAQVEMHFIDFMKTFKLKQSYCDLSIIYKAPQTTRDQILEKLKKAILVFKNMRGDKQDTQPLVKSQAELLSLIGQLFQKISLYSVAITFYQIIGHILKIKRCLNQIIPLNPSYNYAFFIQWGHYFAQNCDFQTSLELYEKAKQKTFDGQELYKVTQYIIEINDIQIRNKFGKGLLSANTKNGKKDIVCKKLSLILNEGRKQLQNLIKSKAANISNKEQKFRNYLSISNIKQQIGKIRGQFN